MKDLTEYARKIDTAPSLPAAIEAFKQLIEQFEYASKKDLYRQLSAKATNKQRLVKWAWDLVLVGDNLKVLK